MMMDGYVNLPLTIRSFAYSNCVHRLFASVWIALNKALSHEPVFLNTLSNHAQHHPVKVLQGHACVDLPSRPLWVQEVFRILTHSHPLDVAHLTHQLSPQPMAAP